MGSASVSENQLLVGFARLGHGGQTPKRHIVGRNSQWGPISGCGHRLVNVRPFKKDDEVDMCGHCARKFL